MRSRVLTVPATASLIAMAALASCENSPHQGPGTGPRGGGSGVAGVVVLWPVCPVEGAPEQREDDCRGEPTKATVHVRERTTDDVAATARAGQDGRFRVSLRPSEYTVTAEVPGTNSCKPIDVIVRPGMHADVTVRCDTGLR
ncbi:carboxypeptidase regulatory-like domain-containing protein [Streptomyces sp. ISL-10]|uniref:carboxypeptidase-like regulatory domain-containing protein n=1 Tax=Streptomyces sp. ISL-10 TaxID=2819172 RepID=UPI001BEB6CBF|nr:carboxypeptidase-like regulatory domain-containing protein [Streptomyces sp. ISL-10]MBT2365800.1 carboxypeptidase regulatory-like domain-containing protein [Streptomyces sp. ISL-10]